VYIKNASGTEFVVSLLILTVCIGKRDSRAQLEGLLEELGRRKVSVEELDRRALSAALVEERMRFCVLVGCLKPLAVSSCSSGVKELCACLKPLAVSSCSSGVKELCAAVMDQLRCGLPCGLGAIGGRRQIDDDRK